VRLAVLGFVVLAGCKQLFGIEDPVLADGGDIPDGGPCAMASAECVGADVLRTCAATGATPTDTACGWGCIDTGIAMLAHCGQIAPAGGGVVPGDVAADPALADVVLDPGAGDTDLFIQADTGRIGTAGDNGRFRINGTGVISGIDFEVTTAGTKMGVFRSRSLVISAPLVLLGGEPIAWVADGEIRVDGVIDARGTCLDTVGGPGGMPGGLAIESSPGMGGGTGGGTDGSQGGGGGGYGGIGGHGGRSAGIGVAGGASFGDSTISILVGGGGGGGGGGASSVGSGSSGGGGGGGAIQLVSNTAITISLAGGINAGGCGGKAATTTNGGGGGGAGGTILLEAPVITIAGTLAVNGGGGGGGDTGATSGQSGLLDRKAAQGGAAGTGGSKGAAGGAASQRDGPTATNASHAGGGGGAVGRIRMNTRGGAADVTGLLSPDFTDSLTTCTQGAAQVQ
jgi:hypothetical protein